MSQAVQGETFEAVGAAGITGLAGTIEILVNDNEGNTVFGPTAAGITEIGASGFYVKTLTAPGVAGEQFTILWSPDGTFDAETTFGDDLLIIAADDGISAPTLLPIDGTSTGPCRAWTTVDAIAECCGLSSDTSVLEPALLAACQTLYALSAKKYTGTCEQRVRPCGDGGCGGPWGGWTGDAWGGLGFGGVYGIWPNGSRPCGCRALSRVPLAGYATEILEVTIDGQILSEDEYRLDEHRWLTRLPDADGNRQWWPACQDLSLPETEDGTFSVLYEYGIDPPVSGQMAATELACAIYQTCGGGGEAPSAEDCPLPNGVTKIEREGITISLDAFTGWAFTETGGWKTGLPLVDLFLNTANPRGRRRRRATVWSPDVARMPRTVGDTSS